MLDPNQFMRDLKKVDQARVDGHNQLARSINQISEQQAKMIQKEQINVMKEILTHAYSRSTLYTQIIIIAGYAAFFTVWNSIKNDLTKTLIYSSCLLVIISAIIFILAEVHKMLSTTSHYQKLNKKISGNTSQNLIETIQNEEQEYEKRMNHVWSYYFYPSLITGFIGGIILIIGIAQGLLHELLK